MLLLWSFTILNFHYLYHIQNTMCFFVMGNHFEENKKYKMSQEINSYKNIPKETFWRKKNPNNIQRYYEEFSKFYKSSNITENEIKILFFFQMMVWPVCMIYQCDHLMTLMYKDYFYTKDKQKRQNGFQNNLCKKSGRVNSSPIKFITIYNLFVFFIS